MGIFRQAFERLEYYPSQHRLLKVDFRVFTSDARQLVPILLDPRHIAEGRGEERGRDLADAPPGPGGTFSAPAPLPRRPGSGVGPRCLPTSCGRAPESNPVRDAPALIYH